MKYLVIFLVLLGVFTLVPYGFAELASFVDPERDPQEYIDRYNSESDYKKWFDENYPNYNSIYDAVGLNNPAEESIQLAKAQHYFGLIKEAFNNYEKALSIDPSNKEAQAGKDDTYNKIQEIEEDYQYWQEKAKEGHSTDLDSLKAGYYWNLGEQKLAIQYADKVKEDMDFHSYKWMMRLYSENGAPEKVVKMYDAIQTFPDSESKAFVALLKVKALWQLEEYEKLALFVKENSAYDMQNRFMDNSRLEDTKANNMLVKAIVFEKIGDSDTAKKYYEDVLNTEYFQIEFTSFIEFMSPEQIELLYGQMVTNEQMVEGKVRFYQYVEDFEELEKMLKILPEERKNEITQEIKYAKILNLYSTSSAYDFSSSDIVCGTGTIEKNGQCVRDPNYKSAKPSLGGGCLIATATYGSELAPQVQQLREFRDFKLLQTEAGSSFIESFNSFYYSFSPYIADYEREYPVFKETVKLFITPMIASLSILNHVDMDSESEVLGYGISLIVLNLGMYVGIPVFAIISIRKKF